MVFPGYLWINKLHYILLKGSNRKKLPTQNSYARSQQEKECWQFLEQMNDIPHIRA